MGGADGLVWLLEVPLDRMTEAEAVTEVISRWERGVGTWVVTPNLDILRQCDADPEVMDLVRAADLRFADGMPLVWSSRLLGDPLPERVAGSNLVWSVAEQLGARGGSVFLLGGDPGVAPHAAETLRTHYPELRVAGTYSPPRGFEQLEGEVERIADALRLAAPDVIYVALPFPRQERLIEQLISALPRACFLGVGISLSFITGDTRRAPPWVRRLGLEWLHRLVHDPRRLFRRYIIHGLPFAVRLLLGSAEKGLRARLRERR